MPFMKRHIIIQSLLFLPLAAVVATAVTATAIVAAVLVLVPILERVFRLRAQECAGERADQSVAHLLAAIVTWHDC